MKRIISLAICLLTVFTLCVPAFADDTPTEIVPSSSVNINGSGTYIIKSGNYSVGNLNVNIPRAGSAPTLIIGRDATVTVTANFNNHGTILVLGTLNVNCNGHSVGMIYVADCGGGTLTGTVAGTVVHNSKHNYEDSVCVHCGTECKHINRASSGICLDCGYGCSHTHTKTVCADCGTEVKNVLTGSVLSDGSLTIICAAIALILGLGGGFILGRKKKQTALADGTESKDEE